MKKRVLAFALCMLMIVSSVPFSPLNLTMEAYAQEAQTVNTQELKKVYDSIPPKSQWNTLYSNPDVIEDWYDYATEILEDPDSYSQTIIDSTKASLERAIKELKYHTSSIALNKTSLTLNVADTSQLTAILNPENAADPVTWTSSNASAVSVSSTGLVTVKAYSANAVTVTATSNGKSASCSVKTVNQLASVKLSVSSKTIYDTEAFNLTASAVGKDSTAAVTNSVKYTWSSDNENVAKVDGGFVTGISKGTTKINVTATDGIATVTASCTVTVNELIAVVGLKAETMTNNGVFSLVVGETGTFKVSITPETASNKTLTWTSADSSIAKIESSSLSGSVSTAKIKAVKAGSTKVTYKTTDGSGKSGSFTVKVSPLVSLLSISETMRVLSVDDKNVTLKTSVSPKDAGNQVLSWTTSNSAVCTVDNKGKLMPQSNGTCVITAKTTDGSNKQVQCKIRVAPRAASVSLNSDALGLKTEQTYTLNATVKTVANSTYTGYVEWISDDTRVATVSDSGVVTAKYPGVAKIKAITLDGTEKVAVCTVSVVQPVKGVSVPSTKTINLGKTATIKPTFNPTYATNQQVTWSSGDTSVATVNSQGVVTAKKVGTCTITCKTSDGGYKAKCTVTVIIPTTSIKLSKTSVTKNAGNTVTLTATVSPSNATNKTVTWKSSDTKVATVSASGVVTAVAGGTAKITATSSGGQTATCTVKVKQTLSSVSLNKTKSTMYVTQTQTLKKTLVPSTATVETFKWSSSDKSVATVDSNGKVTALKKGTATITLKADNLKATCVITVVKKVNVTGVKISTKTKDLTVGDKFTLTATVKPADASNKGVTWSSSNTKVATVTSAGVVKGIKQGTAKITATTADGGYAVKCTVNVCPKVTGIRMSETSANVNIGKSYTLSATVFPTDAIDDEVTWSSSNTKVATVNKNGVVKGIAKGTATITAKTVSGGYKATCNVTVGVLVTKITLNHTSLKIQKGKSKQLLATIAPENASNKKITWKSSDESIATVSESGKVLAKKTGKVTITASGANGKKATCTVKVIQYATEIELNFSSVTVKAGKTKLLVAIVKPSAATDKNVVWSTSNKKVAKVNKNGKVTAVAGGTAVITCTSADGKAKATCKVKVEQPISKIKLDQESLSVKIGAKKTIKATVGPKTATETKLKWTSSDKKIATVSQKGVVKGVSKGKVKITAKSSDGKVKAVCTVKVLKPVTGVSLNKTTITIIKGKKTTITAKVKPADASNLKVKWTSNNYDVVDVDANGKITAKSTGYAEVTAKTSDGGFKKVCKINVIQPAKGMTLEKSKITVDIGVLTTLKANFKPKDATNTAIKWSSSNTSIVKVTSDGKIKGLAKGTAVITAKSVDGGFVSKCTVTVVRNVKSVKLDKTSLVLYTDKTAKLSATVSPSDANDKTITWTSSDASIVKVSNGNLTPVKPGKATITVQTKDGGYKATCTVTVEEPVKSISLSKSSVDLVEGAVYTLSAVLTPSNATNKTVTWTSSDTKVATVSAGKVTAVSKGTATITAKTSNGLTAKCVVNVTRAVSYVSLSANELAMKTGKTATLTATVMPTDASDKTIVWTSSDEKIATVKGGVISALKAGTVTITATASNGLKDQCVVTITDIAVESITLSQTNLEMHTGKTATVVATILPTDATNKDITWTSSDEDIATVKNGVISALKAGEVTITAVASNGLTAQCVVTITDIDVDSVLLSKTQLTIGKGETAKLEATILPEDATDKTVTWESDKEEVATVEDGVVTAVEEGTATITVKTSNGLEATCEVTVITRVTSVELSKTQLALNKGDKAKLKATVLPEDATDKTVTWESDNENVATVKDGTITAVANGTATITATAFGGITATCKVTVTTKTESVVLSNTQLALNKGDTFELIATVLPEDATDKTVTWESDNEAVATVENGIVTAVADGTAKITVTASGGFEATCEVTVTTRVETIVLSMTELALNKGDTAELEVTILPEDATDKTVTWESDDEKVATVKDGVVTAVANGTATITVTASSGITATCKVTVTTKVKSVELSQTALSLNIGDTAELEATVLPEDATDKTVTWESDNEAVATVKDGVVTAVAEGIAIITVRASDGSRAVCVVTVSSVEETPDVPPENLEDDQ